MLNGTVVEPDPGFESYTARPGWRGQADNQRLRDLVAIQIYLKTQVVVLQERVDVLEQQCKC